MTFEELIEECKPIHNHICIAYDSELVRLVGVGKDPYDYYYILSKMNSTELCWYSAVGACVSLKGSYERYDQLDRIFELNGSYKRDDFIIEIDETEYDFSVNYRDLEDITELFNSQQEEAENVSNRMEKESE